MMLQLGMYHGAVGSCNVIGVSKSTEGGSKKVILQLFGQERGGFYYLSVEDFKRITGDGNLRCFRSVRTPVLYDIPSLQQEILPSGIYIHFKGGRYNCLGVGNDLHGQGQSIAIYQSLYGAHQYQLAHRPYDMFVEHVDKPEWKYFGPRFRLEKRFIRPAFATVAVPL